MVVNNAHYKKDKKEKERKRLLRKLPRKKVTKENNKQR